MFIKKNKRRTQISLKTRSNFWGLTKMIKFKRLKWKRIRTNYRIKPQFIRFFKKRLTAQQHNTRRAYKRLLVKKQNFKQYYGNIKESQFKKLFLISKKKNKTTQLENVIISLERRLDVVIFRMGFVNSLHDAHNIITHGKVLVNGNVTKSYNYQLKKQDIISIHPQYKYVVYLKILNQLFVNKLFYILTFFPLKKQESLKLHCRVLKKGDTSNILIKKLNTKASRLRKKLRKLSSIQQKKKIKKSEYLLKLKTSTFLYKYKNKTIINILNQKKTQCYYNTKQFQLFNNISTTPNVLVNFKILVGIYLYHTKLNKLLYHSFMNLQLIQHSYNKK